MRSKRNAYMFMFLMALLCIGLCFFDSFPDKAVATQSGGQNNCPTGSSAGGGAACDKCKTAGQTCGDTWDEWYHDPDDDDDNLSPGSVSGPKFVCVGVESLYTVGGSSDKDKWREMQGTQANSTGCPCTGGDEEQSSGTATDSFQVAAWDAEGQPIVIHGGLQGKLTPNAAGKYDITATVGDLAVQLPTDTGSRNDPDQTTDAFEVTVVAVDSLTPNQGSLVDDGDNNEDTSTYVYAVQEEGSAAATLTVTAAPTPSGVAHDDLPACWSLTGGGDAVDGNEKYQRTVDATVPAKHVIVAKAGISQKTLTIFIVKVDLVMQGLAEETEPTPHEEDPGALIAYNGDDDDSNGTPDRDQQTGGVTGENDLVPTSLSVLPSSLNFGTVTLSAGSTVKAWKTATKTSSAASWDLSSESLPGTVYIEGFSASSSMRDTTITLAHTEAGAEDRVKATVVAVDIVYDGNTVTGQTQDTIVGAPIGLTGQVQPQGFTITAKVWTVPGLRVKNYEASTSAGSPTPLEAADLQGSTVDFFWHDGGDGRSVTYKVTIDGKDFETLTTFNVKRPTLSVTVTKGSTVFGRPFPNIPYGTGEYELAFGNIILPGITFTPSPAVIQAGFSGTYQWVQIVDSELNRMKQYVPDVNDPSQLIGPFWYRQEESVGLDVNYPYTTDTVATDSPGARVNSLIVATQQKVGATMWLMFKPDDDGSIWVPLWKVKWNWEASATAPQTGWSTTVAPSGIVEQVVSSSDTTTFPTWTKVASTGGDFVYDQDQTP